MTNTNLAARLINCWNTGKLAEIDAVLYTEAVDTIEQGDKLAFRFKTTGKRDNAPFTFEGVNILRIEENRVVEDWVYFDATGVKGRLARAQTA
jgi:hypothetical protein